MSKESWDSTPGLSVTNEIVTVDGTDDFEHKKEIDALVTELINSSHEGSLNESTAKEDLQDVTSQISVARKSTQEYRDSSDSSSDDSSSSSSLSSDSDFFQLVVESHAPKKVPLIKTKGELGLEDLPPIEDLNLSVQEEEMTLIGEIHAIVDKLVVIHAIKDMKPLDLDSVLFLSYEKPLGRVFDVFGPVVEPFYCVRFNSQSDINDKGIKIGNEVFFAPEKNDITTYVFMNDLQKQKGSDASWKHNNEPPEEFLDYSDDEQEKAAKRKRMNKNRNQQFSSNSEVPCKRPYKKDDSSPQSNYRNSVPLKNNVQVPFRRHNPFLTSPIPPPSPSPSICSIIPAPVQVQNSFNYHSFSASPLPPPSPTPSMCSVMSTPVRVPNSFMHSTPNRPYPPFSNPQRPSFHQNIHERPPPPLFFTMYQQPVFGQMSLLRSIPTPSPLSPALRNSIPSLMPAPPLAPVIPQNYFNQQFPVNPSISQSQCISPDPWLSRSTNSFPVPPTHPLTVQIPSQNSTSSPSTMHPLQPNMPVTQFVNNNIAFDVPKFY